MTSTITAGFIDLATYDQLERAFYGGSGAITYFVRAITKSTWCTLIPVMLSSQTSTPPAQGSPWSVSISRAGDYLLRAWLRVVTPEITVTSANAIAQDISGVMWVTNLGHNMIE